MYAYIHGPPFIEGATHRAIADAHEKDLKTQNKYGVKFLTYWFNQAIRIYHIEV